MIKMNVFTASWCPACLIMGRRFDKIQSNNEIIIEKYDYDIDKEMFEKYEIGKKIPVLVFEVDGKIVKQIVGEKTEKELQKVIDVILGDVNE